MTETEHQKAARRVQEAKLRMDDARRVLDAAETEWHEAIQDLDAMEEAGNGEGA